MNKALFLSVVVPAKNEEANISRCLGSIIRAVSSFTQTEIILVDCSSTDKTISIAKNYPIKILQLKQNWFHSASAARYIGTLFASGKFIFFIDADMALEAGFLEKALDILDKDSRLAAAGGIAKEVYLKNGEIVSYKSNLYQTKDTVRKVIFLSGAVLYRKKALLEVSGFNPYIRAAEENELAQRLRKKSYDLVSIPFPMAIHYTASLNEWQEFMRKKKMGLFLGIGEAMRISHSVKYLCETLLFYREFAVFFFFILYVLAITIYSLISGYIKYLGFIFLPLCLLFIYLAFKKKRVKTALISLIKWFIISIDIARGLAMPVKDRKAYPTDPSIIKGGFNV